MLQLTNKLSISQKVFAKYTRFTIYILQKKSRNPAIHPVTLANISLNSNDRPAENSCTASIDTAYAITSINEYLSALLWSLI